MRTDRDRMFRNSRYANTDQVDDRFGHSHRFHDVRNESAPGRKTRKEIS
jgi:hypothetical protein